MDLEEQRFVSEDLRHSSNVARVHYQKLCSRDVSVKGRSCTEKLRGDHGKLMDMCVKELREKRSNTTEMEQAIEFPGTNAIEREQVFNEI